MEIGVIIGRFQTPYLTEGHNFLIETVLKRHSKVIILVGVPPVKGTERNPLDYATRAKMIQSQYPNVIISHVTDHKSDEYWSRGVDNVINAIKSPTEVPILYGSRDCFISHYSGVFSTKVLDTNLTESATEARNKVLVEVLNSEDFRKGVITGVSYKYPTVYTTVDVAIFDVDQILLGRKPGEDLFRLIGGFADPSSPSFEADARREVAEETTSSITGLTYIGSFNIDDWRYRNSKDKIRTILFKATYEFGGAVAKDDLDEVRWFKFSELTENDFIPEHRILFHALKQHLETYKTLNSITSDTTSKSIK